MECSKKPENFVYRLRTPLSPSLPQEHPVLLLYPLQVEVVQEFKKKPSTYRRLTKETGRFSSLWSKWAASRERDRKGFFQISAIWINTGLSRRNPFLRARVKRPFYRVVSWGGPFLLSGVDIQACVFWVFHIIGNPLNNSLCLQRPSCTYCIALGIYVVVLVRIISKINKQLFKYGKSSEVARCLCNVSVVNHLKSRRQYKTRLNFFVTASIWYPS